MPRAKSHAPSQAPSPSGTARERGGDRIKDDLFRARVDDIRSCIVAGMRNAQIYTVVARQPAKNRAALQKAKARQQAVLPDTSLWGTGASCPRRTIERYIQRARKQLAHQGRQLPSMGEQIMGTQWARINTLFHLALQRERYHVCARLIEHTSALFGLTGAIKIQFLPQGATPAPAPDTRPAASTTEQTALWEMRQMLKNAMQRSPELPEPLAGKHGTQN